MAVGLFNRAPEAMPVTVKFADIGLSGAQPIRFPWTHTDQGPARTETFTATVPRHGVVLLKVGQVKGEDSK